MRFALFQWILLALAGLWASHLLASDAGSQAPRQYCRAVAGYHFEFPRDHFNHPCYKTEWWYFTGNLQDANGGHFGFELTFFREAVDNPYRNPSRWRIDDLYLAHFAISDIDHKKFFYTQKLNRAGIALAGVDAEKGKVWNGNWSATTNGNQWRLRAADGEDEIELAMKSEKLPVLEGDHGLSQKAAGEGNASYYYSLTRLETHGALRAAGNTFQVSGLSWMDHEFFSDSMQPDQVGWDWVSLQMEDGTEWMFYQFRRKDGSRDSFSSGTFVDREGRAHSLSANDFEMQPRDKWRSPHSGAQYPIVWRIRVPRLGFETEISAAMPDQELRTEESSGVTYWEGSIGAQGARNKTPVTGRGYLEMTGYAGPLNSALQ